MRTIANFGGARMHKTREADFGSSVGLLCNSTWVSTWCSTVFLLWKMTTCSVKSGKSREMNQSSLLTSCILTAQRINAHSLLLHLSHCCCDSLFIVSFCHCFIIVVMLCVSVAVIVCVVVVVSPRT